MSALVLKRPSPCLLPAQPPTSAVVNGSKDSNNNSNTTMADKSDEPRCSASTSCSSLRKPSLTVMPSYVNSSGSGGKGNIGGRNLAYQASDIAITPSSTNSSSSPPSALTNGDINNDNQWQLLDKYRSDSDTVAASSSQQVSSQYRVDRIQPIPPPRPSRHHDLFSGRKPVTPHQSHIMSMSLFGEKDVLLSSSSSPFVSVSSSPKPYRSNPDTDAAATPPPVMFKSAVLFARKFAGESENSANNSIKDEVRSKLSPPAVLNGGKRPASSYDAVMADEDDMDGSLLVEQNFISNARKHCESDLLQQQHPSRSPVLRLFRQPELRLRNSFSGKHRTSGGFVPELPSSRPFHNSSQSSVAGLIKDLKGTMNSVEANLNSSGNSTEADIGAHENNSIVELSPERKSGQAAEGIVGQLVRRPRTFAAAEAQQAPVTFPHPLEPGNSQSVPRSPSSVSGATENSEQPQQIQQSRQRVFPRTNPAFCRRNRQTTVVGGRELSPNSPNEGEPVELLPGGIVYESSAPHVQRSQTLDSRYRSSNQQQQQHHILASPVRQIHHNPSLRNDLPSRQVFASHSSSVAGEIQPPFSQPLERKFSYDPSQALSPLPLSDLAIQNHPQPVGSAEVTPRGGLTGGDLTPTFANGSSQRSLNKDSLDSGYLPSDHHPSTSSSHQMTRQSNSSAAGSYRRPSTSSSSSEPLSSSLERSPSPMRKQQQRQAARRRPAPSSRRRHGNPPSTIFEPPASDASSDLSDCGRPTATTASVNNGPNNMANSVAYHEGSMSDPDTLLHVSASLSRGQNGTGTTGSYVGAHRNGGASIAVAPHNHYQIPSPIDKSGYSTQTADLLPGRPLSMLISQSEVSVGTATHNLIMSGMATGGNHRRHQPASSSALLLQHHHSMLNSAGGSLRLTPLQLLRKAGAAGTLPGSVGCAHGVALAAALQMYARTRKPLFSDADIELYAQQFMASHRKGLFGRKLSVSEMLCWTKELIQKPMLRTTCDKAARRLCVDTFRLIQQYMGDRRTTTPSLAIAAEIVTRGWLHPNLRDEIYMQLCRQTTETPVQESLERGWELMATCLNFFPPSLHFYGYIESYVFRHTDQNYDTPKVPVSHYASYCLRQLERVVESGAKKGVKRPTIDEIDQARASVFQPSMFGATLDDIMLVQATRFPNRRLPWIQTTLSEAVLRLNGAQTEGIFRIPGDIDEVNALKARVNQWLPPDNIRDPHVPASLLKLWYRELWTPVMTPDLYAACLAAGENAQEAIQIFASLPEINRLVLAYLIRFLQVFAAPCNAAVTKMDVSNLAMVFAPNVLRCSSDDPRVIFESTRKEMTFLRTLILHLDTGFVEGVV